LRILCYHKIQNTQLFEQQIVHLKKHYHILSLQDFLAKLEKDLPLCKNDVLISFDDGDLSLITNAFPVLQRHGVPAVAFVITSLINTVAPFWWDEVLYYTGSMETVRRLKTVREEERLHAIEELRSSGKERMQYMQLKVEQLRELEAGGIAIASHTHTHPMLDQCSEATLHNELRTSARLLKEWGFPFYDVFAYPNGNSNKTVIAAVKAAGYRAAFVFDHALTRNPISTYAISRLSVTDETPMWKFRLILSGLHSLQLQLRKKIRR
jgi:peptidoglycan/xylan/chitin deacetylase (PgdA/CDA1 family)